MAMSTGPVTQLPEPFNFYRIVLDGDHLHFGLWPEDSPDLSLEEAQERMLDLLVSQLPKPPVRVLDVGCGLGRSASHLAQKGYKVVAIDRSEALIAYASASYGGSAIDFHVIGFLDENEAVLGAAGYDVIFFQESLQYLHPLDSVFKKARSLLAAGGMIVIGDETCQDMSIKQDTAVHLRKDVIAALFENGFRITVEKHIGDSVKRTCDCVISRFKESFDSIVSQVNKPDTEEKLKYFLDGWQAQKRWYAKKQMGYSLFIAKKDEIFIRTYREGDENNILPLFNEVFKVQRTKEHWYWKFRDNPFGTRKIAIAHAEDGTIAAHFSGYPVPFHSSVGQMQDPISFQGGDTMTNPKFRGSGLGKTSVLTRTTTYFYNKMCMDTVPFLYGYNTGQIRKFGERFLGYEYISSVPYQVLKLTRRRGGKVSGIRRILLGLSVEAVREVSTDFDRFFARAAKNYGFLVKRTSTYLRWRYLDCPDRTHQVYAVRSFGRIVGWGAFSRSGNVLRWGDALFDKGYGAAVSYLLDYLQVHVYRDISSIEGWFSPLPTWWTTILSNIGFEAGREPDNLAPLFKIFDTRFSTGFFERNFYYTMGDSDLF